MKHLIYHTKEISFPRIYFGRHIPLRMEREGESLMVTFIIGLAILFVGGCLYGKFCESVFEPDDRETPAYAKQDGVDYVPMKTWKNSLINLLNIAGTGPILGPIQGILFGPIAFLAIPIGNVIGGSMHDYMSGMICTRDGGTQMPDMIKNYTNKGVYILYDIFMCILLLLVGAVFIYTPGDILSTQVLGFSGSATAVSTWVIYSCIFVYYLIATVFPIDKIIGRVYPIFGLILIISAVGIFIAIFAKGYPLTDIWANWNTVSGTVSGSLGAAGGASDATMNVSGFDFAAYFKAGHFIPEFFLTVACGILSGFHSTQTALISRTMESEKNGRMCFYNMMIVEGFIAMCWAAGTMGMINLGADRGGVSILGANKFLQASTEAAAMKDGALQAGYFAAENGSFYHIIAATSVVGVICKNAMGPILGMIGLIGVIVLPITSGDTALRALRLTLADSLHLKQDNNGKRLGLAIPVFILVYVILVWAKTDANGFNILWRYFAWANQMISLFALACIAAYLAMHNKKQFMWIPLIPAAFYAFCTSTYLIHNPAQTAGTAFMSWNTAYVIGAIFTICYLIVVVLNANKKASAVKAASAKA